jgi:1-deoxy-D-xylulose-5-phosphate reductoisomerase
MVEFRDGAIKAQLGTPDMRVPIQYALTFPTRRDCDEARFDFSKALSLTFEPVDRVKFPALDIAYDCLRRGGTAPCVMNAANEVAVDAFLHGRIGYVDIVKVIERTLAAAAFTLNPDIDVLALCDAEARKIANYELRITE